MDCQEKCKNADNTENTEKNTNTEHDTVYTMGC